MNENSLLFLMEFCVDQMSFDVQSRGKVFLCIFIIVYIFNYVCIRILGCTYFLQKETININSLNRELKIYLKLQHIKINRFAYKSWGSIQIVSCKFIFKYSA